MSISLHTQRRPQPWTPEDRYRFLSAMLESFAGTLDLKEVLRRIVEVTLTQFAADRVVLISPVSDGALVSNVRYTAAAPGVEPIDDSTPIQLTPAIVRRALDSNRPLVILEGDPSANPELMKRFGVRSAMMQILRPQEDAAWIFAMQQCTEVRHWNEEEMSLFAEIGRYATLALNNTLVHERAVREIAKASAILDQIPEPAAIYDASGRLERMNAAAQEASQLFAGDPETRLRLSQHRHVTGGGLQKSDLPSMRALRGELVDEDYLVRDPRTSEDRVVNLKAAPIRDAGGEIIGSVVLSRDVTEEHSTADREQVRRRRAETLANLGLDPLILETSLDNLDEPAKRIGRALGATVRTYLYRNGFLDLVGFSGTPETDPYRAYFSTHPYRPGEGVAGTAFQIGRPLLFYDIRGNDMLDFARDDEERAVKAALKERSLIAAPIESYGERIGALVVSHSDARRKFDAEDLEFIQAVAERIGAAAHTHRLTRVSLEGHRAAEELARREVDARVRFEAVLETAPIAIAAISADELRFELANALFVDFANLFGKVSPDTRLLQLRVDEVIPDLDAVVRRVAESGEAQLDEELEIRTGGRSRYINRIVSPVRGRFSGTTQSITVLVQDVTDQLIEERANRERETRRRRHAECLAKVGVEAVVLDPLPNLNEPAKSIAEAMGGSAIIYLYSRNTGELRVAGLHSPNPEVIRFVEYLSHNPYHAGEGIPGTVFQIGRPLFFSDVRGDAVIDFGRDKTEKALISAMNEQTLIASPIESYGDSVGSIVVARSKDRNFDAEDLEFVQSVAERLGAAIHIHDLTRISQEGHRAAEDLARREVDARVRFEAVLETAPIGVAVISADELRFELANARWLEFASQFGKISSDTRVVDLRVAEVIPGWEQTLKQVAEAGELRFDQEFEIPARSGVRYVNRIISPVRGRFSGTTQNLTVLIQDVSDQVRAKREIEALAQMMAERSARLDSILGSMTDGLWVYDAAADVVDVNQAALTMFGVGSRTEAIDLGSFERFYLRYPDGRPIPREDLPYARALRGMTVPDYLAIGRHLITGRDLDLSIAAAPIESNGVVGAVLVIRDITALQELDRKKDEFLSVASHELRTPLTTIKGYTQLLSQGVDELGHEDRVTYLNAVLSEIDRMMGLITELLDVSRIETNRLQLEPQPVRWMEFLQRRATAFRVQNPSRKINFDAAVPETMLTVDPDRMRQVIDNLLSNALKYSPDSTEVFIHVTVHDGSMLTSFTDRGIGIPADEIPRLFERFHRARNVSSRYYGGLGLGLYIARAIVEAHHGAISVESEEGKGATFTIRLPMP